MIPLSDAVRDLGVFLEKKSVDDESHNFNCKVVFLSCALFWQTTSVSEQKNWKCKCFVTCPVMVGLLQQLFAEHAKEPAAEATAFPEHCCKNCHSN